MTFKDWAIQQHRDTNHKYDGILPYEFHLEMVVTIAKRFETIWNNICTFNIPARDAFNFNLIIDACYGHDLIEDTRVTYNDVLLQCKFESAAIIYALTNEKGRNRKERANDKYYEGIRNTPGAVFVKLCDRIANVKYGLLTGGSMLEKYEKENMHFLQSLGIFNEQKEFIHGVADPYWDMVLYLLSLFKLKEQI